MAFHSEVNTEHALCQSLQPLDEALLHFRENGKKALHVCILLLRSAFEGVVYTAAANRRSFDALVKVYKPYQTG